MAECIYVLFGYVISNASLTNIINSSFNDIEAFNDRSVFLHKLRNGGLESVPMPLPVDFEVAFNHCGEDPDIVIYANVDLGSVLRGEQMLPKMDSALEWADKMGFTVDNRIPEIHELPYYCAADFFS